MYKVFCAIAGAALLPSMFVVAEANAGPQAKTLAGMRDKSRALLIFYPEGQQILEQRAYLSRREAELKDRDVVLMFLPLVDERPGTASRAGELQRHFNIEGGKFTVVLVGKDGGEKFRSHEPVTIEKLEALIDAMPMRQQEVRDGHHPK